MNYKYWISGERVKNYNIVYFRVQDCTCKIFLRCETLTFYTKFVLTWVFCLKLNLSKTIHFLTRTWFLYVLTKYQAMFKVLHSFVSPLCLHASHAMLLPFQRHSGITLVSQQAVHQDRSPVIWTGRLLRYVIKHRYIIAKV
jgi:hypothetical protein